MISMKQMMVKSTAPLILLHCDVIGNIQHLRIRTWNRESSSKCSTSHGIYYCLKFGMSDPHDLIIEIYDEKKYSSKFTTFLKIPVFVMPKPYYIIQISACVFVLVKRKLTFFSPFFQCINVPLKKRSVMAVWHSSMYFRVI